MEVVIMTGNQKTIQWVKPRQNGSRKGAKNAKSGRQGRRPVSERQARLDGLATIVKGFIGTDSFVSVRENGPVVLFRENGRVIAQADASQDFGGEAEILVDLVLEDDSEVTVAVAAMKAQQTSVSRLDKGVARKCWLVKTTDGSGRATYRPEGVACVDGKVLPVRESAARSHIAMQIAWAMAPRSAKKDGKRVKFNVRSKDGKGTRYTFRYDGADIAEFYHDGRFEDLGSEARPLEHYLARAGVPCVEDGSLMAKLASCMVSPGYKSDVDEDVDEDEDVYDDDEAYFAGVTAEAVKGGLIGNGQSIENFDFFVRKDGKFQLRPRVNKAKLRENRSKLRDVELDFGGDEPAIAEASPAERQQAEGSRPSQYAAAAAAATAQVAVAPAAA